MRYCKKRNQFEASNVSYNADFKSAFSYRWWKFVSVIGKKTVFNNYNYSVSTRKHQNKVRNLMASLGHPIDVFVSIRDSLENITTLKELKERELRQKKKDAEIAEMKRLERNKKARERRQKAKEMNNAAGSVQGQIAINQINAQQFNQLRVIK